MRVLGITGGVGSGKSEVLDLLRDEYKASVIRLDDVAAGLERKGQMCFEKIVDYFGTEILRSDGELDREKLGAIVFSDREKLEMLNTIVHPAVKRWLRADMYEKEWEEAKLYVVESALFPDIGYEDICGEVWYIYAEESVRRERLKRSRGYTDEKISQIIEAQPSEERFRSMCTSVIDNSQTLEDTKRQIGELLR